jgi:hypothetical protein
MPALSHLLMHLFSSREVLAPSVVTAHSTARSSVVSSVRPSNSPPNIGSSGHSQIHERERGVDHRKPGGKVTVGARSPACGLTNLSPHQPTRKLSSRLTT